MLVLYNALSWIPASAGMTAGASDFALATSDRLGRGRQNGQYGKHRRGRCRGVACRHPLCRNGIYL